MFALFENDKQASKVHSTKEAAMVEAFERGAVIDMSADFHGDCSGRVLAAGYSIRKLESIGGNHG